VCAYLHLQKKNVGLSTNWGNKWPSYANVKSIHGSHTPKFLEACLLTVTLSSNTKFIRTEPYSLHFRGSTNSDKQVRVGPLHPLAVLHLPPQSLLEGDGSTSRWWCIRSLHAWRRQQLTTPAHRNQVILGYQMATYRNWSIIAAAHMVVRLIVFF
jgi:hypothetical protein